MTVTAVFDTPEGKQAMADALPYVEQAVAKVKVACLVEIEATDWPGLDILVEPKVRLMTEKLDWITKTAELWSK